LPTSADARERIRAVLLPTEHAAELDAHGTTRAAVLVPLVELRGRIHVVLTRRPATMRRHAGEIAFPGGRSDDDDPTPTATALREAHEEIGLRPENVEVLGALSPVGTFVTGYAVYPVVGWVEHPGRWELSPREVDAVLELDLEALRESHEQRRLVRQGVPFLTDTYTVDGHEVWGATGRMLKDLFARLPPDLVGAIDPAAR
jgi:8-oxo-dGTP pyrophosphatase MutT (NUDIX family)